MLGVCDNIEIKAVNFKAVKFSARGILERIERYFIDQDILCIFQLDFLVGIGPRRIHQIHEMLVDIFGICIREGLVEQRDIIDYDPFVRILFKPGKDILKGDF